VIVGLAFAGVFAYVVVNVLASLIALSLGSSVAFGVAAVFLALVAIGGGAALIILRRSWALGLGLGLLIGWALASIVSAGYCTGLNPGLYT
jgi:hypothetical protein